MQKDAATEYDAERRRKKETSDKKKVRIVE
jgi:hypothetical protein